MPCVDQRMTGFGEQRSSYGTRSIIAPLLPDTLDQLKAQGYPVDDADVAHLWPPRYANINPYGRYRFNVEGEFHRKGLRPLRQPDSALA